MSKKHRTRKRCGRIGGIERRVFSSYMWCFTMNTWVFVQVDEEKGNCCTCPNCPFSPAYVRPEVETDARLTA